MKAKIKRIISNFFAKHSEYVRMIFLSAAENHILISHRNKNQKKFRSYTQLKKHQRRVRSFLLFTSIFIAFLLVGSILGPVIFPRTMKTEVDIPNGKGDILLGNVSKNQATIIFKTLDAENGYKPLATRAFVEVYTDSAKKQLMHKTDVDDYAVTHVIPITGLQEGKKYYIRISASDSENFAKIKTVDAWGNGSEQLSVFATGETVDSACAQQNKNVSVKTESDATAVKVVVPTLNTAMLGGENETSKPSDSLDILSVQNENHLQPGNKVQTIISWKTNFPATTTLIYKEGNNGEKKELNISDQKQIKHVAILTTLTAGKVYYFQVKSTDEKGRVVVSNEYSLHTPWPQKTIMEQIGDNFKALVNQIKPN